MVVIAEPLQRYCTDTGQLGIFNAAGVLFVMLDLADTVPPAGSQEEEGVFSRLNM